jgi:hypothetical protein
VLDDRPGDRRRRHRDEVFAKTPPRIVPAVRASSIDETVQFE